MNCPSCGKIITTQELCPYCGAKTNKRLSIKLIKFVAVIGSVLGILILLIYAKKVDAPTIKIKDIIHTMNFGIVKISGIVEKKPFITDRYISFTINDGTGIIYAKAYGRVAEKIFPPNVGDSVEIIGTLQIKEENPSLIINAADRVYVKKEPTPIGKISFAEVGKPFFIKGFVKSYKEIKGGTIIEIADSTGEIKVVKWGDKPILWPGKEVKCFGELKSYKNALEIVAKRLR